MLYTSQNWLVVVLLSVLIIQCSQALLGYDNGMKSAVFLSPKFMMKPGSVVDKFYGDIDFPKGHIAIKEFNAEVVDEAGNPVPLHETYLHHWVLVRYHARENVEVSEDAQVFKSTEFNIFDKSDITYVRNSGICQGSSLGQYFGLGSETRRTSTFVPDPYGIEVGNEVDVPAGYEEKWMLNVHAIDTRNAEDKIGCTECRCNLYNVTKDGHGRPLSPNYEGGLACCHDQTQCKVKEGSRSTVRNLYMRYTVKWMDWDDSILPVKIYIFDVTDTWQRLSGSAGLRERHHCQIEYEIEPCVATGEDKDGCIDTKRTSLAMPNGGYVIYGVSHQHSGGRGAALYGEDGRVICASKPTYGSGIEAGNENGYIVGMSTCYPQAGSVQISDGELLTLESNYSSSRKHTGVMGLFYLLIADQPPKPKSFFRSPVQVVHGGVKFTSSVWAVALFGAVVLSVAVAIGYLGRKGREDGYESLAM